MTKQFIFTHIPKTGGGAIKIALALPQSHGHTPVWLYPEDERDASYKFAFIRHPFLRFYSAITEDHIVRHKIMPDDKRHNMRLDHAKNLLENESKSLIDRFRGPIKPNRNLDGYSSDTFGASKTKGRALGMNPTRAPMEYWICNPDKEILVDFVGTYENLSTDYDKICKTIEVDGAPLQKIRWTKDHKPKPEAVYNKTVWERILTLYERDYEIFGFSTDPQETFYINK